MMDATERAKMKRLEKRRDSLFRTLLIIRTWLTFPDDPQDKLYRIGELVAERIEAERMAQRHEERRDIAAKGGAA